MLEVLRGRITLRWTGDRGIFASPLPTSSSRSPRRGRGRGTGTRTRCARTTRCRPASSGNRRRPDGTAATRSTSQTSSTPGRGSCTQRGTMSATPTMRMTSSTPPQTIGSAWPGRAGRAPGRTGRSTCGTSTRRSLRRRGARTRSTRRTRCRRAGRRRCTRSIARSTPWARRWSPRSRRSMARFTARSPGSCIGTTVSLSSAFCARTFRAPCPSDGSAASRTTSTTRRRCGR
mmetsp:Transcript_29542/g.84970  ORF Transcript_29542/g.84970 Transcript_29542/m.84970 type:complete len:232 (-) Transcript_29542:613-1308(-)